MKLRNLATLCFFLLSPFQGVMAETVIPADMVLIRKEAHTLTLMHGGNPMKTYKVSLGPDIHGPKTARGDGKTPEGSYVIESRNIHSHYHRALKLSYPNAQDRQRAARLHVDPGGDIMIHGLPNGQGWIGSGHLARDWTLGCIALTNAQIEEVWDRVPNGTPVTIVP